MLLAFYPSSSDVTAVPTIELSPWHFRDHCVSQRMLACLAYISFAARLWLYLSQKKSSPPWICWMLGPCASTLQFSCPLLCGWISVMFIGNITRGQTSYQRRDYTWLRAISYLLTISEMRLLGKTHHIYFRICSFYYSWSHLTYWHTFGFSWATITEFKRLSPSLDQISGLLLFSLGT